jgi:spermidine synthase
VFRSDRFPEIFGLTLGVYATLAQVVLMREALTLAGGNELAVGLGLGAWLTAVGLGALIAGPLPRPRAATTAAAISAGPFSAAGLMILRLNRHVLDLPAGQDPTLAGLALTLVAGLGLGGLTVGFIFTVAARAVVSSATAPVSRLYTFEALGALLAGVLFTFVLAGAVPPLTVIGMAAALLCAGGAATAAARGSALPGAIAAALLVVASSIALPRLDDHTARLAFDHLGSGELVASAESAYGRLAIGRSEGQHQLLADGWIDHSFPDPWERAPEIHLALTQHRSPKRVLLVGGGPPDRLEAALAHGPDQVVLTYLDERAHDLSRPFWSRATTAALADSRVRIVRDDGRRFVVRTADRFDVVVVSARPPLSGQANRYHTREFMSAVRRVLAPGGTMTALAPGGANILAPEAARAAASAIATVSAVFAEVILVPGLKIAIHAAGEKGVLTTDPEVLARRFEQRGVRSPTFTARRFAPLLESSRIEALTAQIDRWPAAINTDRRPHAYLANLQLWERGVAAEGEAARPTWTGFFERHAWILLVVPLGLWALWRGIRLARRRRSPAGDAVFSIATTGAAGMACEVVVLYAFQAASGRLYTGLALLIGLFMAGLAAGAYCARRWLVRKPAAGSVIADCAALLLMLASGPVLSLAIDLPWVIAAWSSIAGLVTGLAFPALLAITASRRGGDERRAAAVIESADHLGAAGGALITGVVWLPVFGIVSTCLMFAAFKAASLIGLVPSVRGRGEPDRRPLNREPGL